MEASISVKIPSAVQILLCLAAANRPFSPAELLQRVLTLPRKKKKSQQKNDTLYIENNSSEKVFVYWNQLY